MRQRCRVEGLFHMMRFPATGGLKVREAVAADARGIAKVHVDAWRETYQEQMPKTFLNALRYDQRESYWVSTLNNGSAIVLVAENSKAHICGFACGGRERSGHAAFDSELYAIYLLRSYQKLGVGKELFEAVSQRLAAQGFKSMIVWVLDTNPARGFYETMGGRREGERDERFGDLLFHEVAYGFDIVARQGRGGRP